MVADSCAVITHFIHETNLHFTFEKRIIARALAEVARVEEQEVWVLGTLFLNHINTTEETRTTSKILIIKIRAKRHDGGMGIISMENDELLLFLGTHCEH